MPSVLQHWLLDPLGTFLRAQTGISVPGPRSLDYIGSDSGKDNDDNYVDNDDNDDNDDDNDCGGNGGKMST